MKILVNTRIGENALAYLIAYGHTVHYPEPPEPFEKLNSVGTREVLMDCDGYIAGTEQVGPELLEGNTQLKVIARVGSGIDNVDLELCKRMGIKVMYTPVAPAFAVAELAMGLMIGIARRIPLSDRAVRNGEWPPAVHFAGTLIKGKTIGIAGTGRIGAYVARLLFPWHITLLGHDVAESRRLADVTGMEYVDKDELLAHSDFLLLHLSLTDKTRGWIGADELARMKPTAYLVNTARGELVDEAALLNALNDGDIAGAALDVFTEEPYNGPLTGLPNVILTRHIGSWTTETRWNMERQAAEAVCYVLAGKSTDNWVASWNTWQLAE